MTTDRDPTAAGQDGHDDETARFWDLHFQARPAGRLPRANPLLVESIGSVTPGAALDLGCGAGGDTLWLAALGWQVTAVDISAVAVEQVAEYAASQGLADRVTTERHDLSLSFPSGRFDLVSAQYFHVSSDTARHRILRAAAQAVLPRGRLLVVDHGSVAPWSWNQDPTLPFPTPYEVAAELGLDPSRWVVERADTPARRAVGPGDGPGPLSAMVIDHVLMMRRDLDDTGRRDVTVPVHPSPSPSQELES